MRQTLWPVLQALGAGLALALTVPAHAQTAPASPSLAGHYYLEGVMETGSELLLRPDGRFSWYISYGAFDAQASGHWAQDGQKVTLTADATPADPPPFREMVLELGPDGALRKPGSGPGAYRRHDDHP